MVDGSLLLAGFALSGSARFPRACIRSAAESSRYGFRSIYPTTVPGPSSGSASYAADHHQLHIPAEPADASMDASASALGLCSLAAYLYFCEKDFQKAVVASEVLAACAVFTHPNSAQRLIAVVVFAKRP